MKNKNIELDDIDNEIDVDIEDSYQEMIEKATARRYDGHDLLMGDYYKLRNPKTVEPLSVAIDTSEVYLFPTYKQPKLGKRMSAIADVRTGKVAKRTDRTKEEKLLYRIEMQEYMRQMYVNLGLNEQRGVPSFLNTDDLVRLEAYNRRSRGNRLAGSGHMQNIPIDIYTWIWKNSVILMNMRHVFMLTRKDISHAMKIEVSSIQKAMIALENIGLLVRVGKCKRGNNAYNLVYEMKDLDTFFAEHTLKTPANYKIRERVSDIIWNTDLKQGRKKKDIEEKNKKRRELIESNPYWGLFVGDVDK